MNIFFRNPLAQMEEEKREHDAKIKRMEAEMEQVFEMKVREKKQKLKDSEAEVRIIIVNNCVIKSNNINLFIQICNIIIHLDPVIQA